MWSVETNISEAIDFLRYAKWRHKTIKPQHKVVNVMGYIFALGWYIFWALIIWKWLTKV